MENDRLAFVEDFGIMFERLGSTRMLGRVWGALMVADPPEMTADELAEVLKASRGSISQATRQLIELGVVQRINKAGIRRDFYKIRPNAWQEAMRREEHSIVAMQQLFKRGLAAMEGTSCEARRPLEESIAFTEFWLTELGAIFERWEAHKEQSHG
jgi:DNA-binding transcriptional regulator GbsR (MarR family)